MPSPIESALQSGSGVNPSQRDSLRKFYAARQNAPAWYDQGGLNADGRAALAVLSRAAEDGLDPARYELENLARPFATNDATALAYRDLTFTASLLRYASDMLDGQPAFKHLDSDVDLPASGYDIASGAAQAVATHKISEFLWGLEPQLPQYAPLKTALARYRTAAANGGWPAFAARKAFTAASATPQTLAELQARLGYEDVAVAGPIPASVEEMDAAIKRFQARNGLEAEGNVGAATIAQLNVTASGRAAQIAANMERLRWLPHRFEKAYVQVNVPDASLAVMENGAAILTSRVIVGRPHDRTPIFRAEITGIVANPPWIVPATIARHEIAPKAAADPDYLARNHIVLENGRYRQIPGDDNALGDIKLNVTDRFAVYLHDTPARSLFAKPNRFLSHGCIRVQQIKPLASYALNGDVTSGVDRLDAAIATTQTTPLPIKAPIPLYVVYLTAFPSPDGLQFRSDIYGRDKRLIAAMFGATSYSQAFPAVKGCNHKA
ncbi:MAG: L,D-transpeptidase family protein [Rhizomicrobium sp.]